MPIKPSRYPLHVKGKFVFSLLFFASLLLPASASFSQSIDGLFSRLSAAHQQQDSVAAMSIAEEVMTGAANLLGFQEFSELASLVATVSIENGEAGPALSWLERQAGQLVIEDDSLQKAALYRDLAMQFGRLGASNEAADHLEVAIRITKSFGQSALELEQSRVSLLIGNDRLDESLVAYRNIIADLGSQDSAELARTQTEIIKLLVRDTDLQLDQLSEEIGVLQEQMNDIEDSSVKAVLGLQVAGAIVSYKPTYVVDFSSEIADFLSRAETELAADSSYMAYVSGYKGAMNLALFFDSRYEGKSLSIDEAFAFTRGALLLSYQNQLETQMFRWQRQLARIYLANNDVENALANYEAALVSLASVETQLSSNTLTMFNDHVFPVYQEYLELLIGEALKPGQLSKNTLVTKIQEVIESRNRSEILEYFAGNCLFPTNLKSLSDVEPGTAVVYPIALTDRLIHVVRYNGGIEIYDDAQVGAESLAEKASEFRTVIRSTFDDLALERSQNDSSVSSETINETIKERALEMYGWIVAPILTDLNSKNIEKLVFVSTPQLRTVPLAALHNGSNFLVEEFVIASTLGMRLTDSRQSNSKDRVLLGGVSQAVSGLRLTPGFSALSFAEAELNDIAQLMGSSALIDSSFVLPDVTDQLAAGNYSIAHLATHAYFGGDSATSYILTFNEKLRMDMLQDTVGIRRFVEQPLDLLVLSACETAVGNEKALLGLAGVSLKAGALSTLASLWQVNDASTATLMTYFYSAKQQGLGKAESLQYAQKAMIERIEFSHPFQWSAFNLIGNWN